MRFLLHPTRVSPTAIRRPSAVAASKRVAVDHSAASVGVQSSVATETKESTRKWGQHHCGTSCSCILRMDVTIDTDGVVTSASYSAKSVLPQFNATNTLFLSDCSCASLHRLAQKSCAYQLHKTAFQITNNMHSSIPVKRHIANAHKTQPHCYDLLYQTLFALWHQRIPHTTTTATMPTAEITHAEHEFYEGPDHHAANIPERTVWTPWWWIKSTTASSPASDTSLLQQHLDRLEPPVVPPVKGPHRDWLSYVDEIQDNEMEDRWMKSA